MTLLAMRLEIHEIHAAVVSSSITIIYFVLHILTGYFSESPALQEIQTINNCPLPSRIFHGRQAILETMQQFFTLNLGKQQIYVLHGLGGVGKTQIALKFIQQSSQ